MSDRDGSEVALDVGDGDDVVDVSLSNDGIAESGVGSRALADDEEIADVDIGSDKALLMGAAPGAGGFGDGAIVNWHSFARPFEAGVLGVVALMLSFGLGGGDWLHGTNGDLAHVSAGLKSASVGNATGRLSEACHPEEPGDAVTCAVASAGGWGAAFLTLALLACVMLIVRLVLEELYTRGMLAVALARLNEKVPLQKLAPLRTLGPAVSWGALVCFQYLGLLAYAAKAPATLGAGAATLGGSYGLVRLATVASALGATAHYAASRAVEDSLLLETLDSVKNALTGLERRPRMLQVALLCTLGFEVLRWVGAVGWGGLLPLYGLAAQSLKSKNLLSLYACAAAFSCAVDVLSLASSPADALLWLVLLSKGAGLGILLRFRAETV